MEINLSHHPWTLEMIFFVNKKCPKTYFKQAINLIVNSSTMTHSGRRAIAELWKKVNDTSVEVV